MKYIFSMEEEKVFRVNRKVFPWNLLAINSSLFLLLTIGAINLYSATSGSELFWSQLKHMALGVLVFIFFAWVIPIKTLSELSYPYFFFIALLLIIVLLWGYKAGGAQRWLNIAGTKVQPSEFAKIAIIFYIAKFFAHYKPQSTIEIIELWPVFLACGGVFTLIFLQPDFGTAGLCLFIALYQLACLPIRFTWRIIGSLILFALAAAAICWQYLLYPYQKLRVLNLINPHLDPGGSGYNSIQSLIAFGSGGFAGKGFSQNTQSYLHFLPAHHTDFVFSVFAEEFGFVGVAFVFALFLSLWWFGMKVAYESNEPFKALMAIGVSAFIFMEFYINIAMVLGVFPVVGMPLPFFSYGGSSLLSLFIGVGLLINIDRSNRRKQNFRGLL